MKIRKLNNSYDDYNQFFVLINQFRETSFTYEEFSNLISNKINVYIIEENSLIIAAATIYYEYKFIFNCCYNAHIEDVIVDINHRRKGYGKILISFLLNLARNNKCLKLTLNCSDDNIKFYESCGLEKRGNQMSYLFYT